MKTKLIFLPNHHNMRKIKIFFVINSELQNWSSVLYGQNWITQRKKIEFGTRICIMMTQMSRMQLKGCQKRRDAVKRSSVVECYEDDGKLCLVVPTEATWWYIQYDVRILAFGHKLFHKKLQRHFWLPPYKHSIQNLWRMQGCLDTLIGCGLPRMPWTDNLHHLVNCGWFWVLWGILDVAGHLTTWKTLLQSQNKCKGPLFIDFGNNVLFDTSRYVMTPSTTNVRFSNIPSWVQARS